jgi:hypothetical protein
MYVQSFCWSASLAARGQFVMTYPPSCRHAGVLARTSAQQMSTLASLNAVIIARSEVWIVDIPEYELS